MNKPHINICIPNVHKFHKLKINALSNQKRNALAFNSTPSVLKAGNRIAMFLFSPSINSFCRQGLQTDFG